MKILRIALLQALPSGWDQAANLDKGESLCRRARGMGADIILFPEMWNIGYKFFDPSDPPSRDKWKSQAITTDSDFIRHFRNLARELNTAIAITYLQQWDEAPRNSVSLIDRHGEIRMTYAKVHPCEFDFEAALTPGNEFCVRALDTEAGDVQIGAMICFDREFPESARVLMLQGAEIILTPNSCTMERNRLGQFTTRAYENMVALALANYPAPLCNGHSIAVDPIAFGENETSRDMILVEAGEEEGIYLAEFDLTAIRDYRKKEVWGNAYRKPRSYGALTSLEVREPFVRRDSRR
jgi:N-carbamoylputrescine amidase